MNYVQGESRDQELLLPERLDDYVEESNPVRFMEAFVDRLNMAEHVQTFGIAQPIFGPDLHTKKNLKIQSIS